MEIDNEMINKAVAAFMNLCWHEWKERPGYNPNIPNSWPGKDCVECKAFTSFNPDNGIAVDFCSPDSPRCLLDDVRNKVIEEYGLDAYGRALTGLCFQDGVVSDIEHASFLLAATPKQITRAIYHVITRKGYR